MPRPIDERIARLAVDRGWLRPAQAEAALLAAEMEQPAAPVEVLLVELGMLDLAQVAQLLSAHVDELAALDPRARETLGAWRFAALSLNRGLGAAPDLLRGLRVLGRRSDGSEPKTHVGETIVDGGLPMDAATGNLSRGADATSTGAPPAPGPGSAAGVTLPDSATFAAASDGHGPTGPACPGATRVPPAPAPGGAASPSFPRRPGTEAAVTIGDERAGLRTQPAPPEHSARVTSAQPPGSAPPPPPVHSGRRIGQYDILEELGHGGMGIVYKAWHAGLRRYYAVKCLPAGDDASQVAVQRLRKEAQALARLSHPGIVAVQDVWEDAGRTFLAMEFVDGVTLDRVLHALNAGATQLALEGGAVGGEAEPARVYDPLRRTVGLAPTEAVRIARETAEAIQYAHDLGVIHRDLKPANLLQEESGRVKVMDFGLAKLIDGGGTKVTQTGALMGTPAYISPEQVDEGMEVVNTQSDVYQIGAILYELLTGRPPYEGEQPMEILLKVSQRDPIPPRTHNPRIARDAETICLTAMARDRARRYATARALAEDCRRFLEGEAIVARREGRVAKGVRWARRHRAWVAAAAVVVLAAAIAGGAAWTAHSARVEQAELERQVLDGLREISRTNLTGALLVRRAGGRMDETEAAFLEPLQAAVVRAVERAPGRAGPHYCLGRMYRALLRFEDALAEQDRALAKEPDHAQALYERAILRALDLARRLGELRRRWLEAEGRRLAGTGALAQGGGGTEAVREPPRDAELIAADPDASALRAAIAADLVRLERSAAKAELSPAILACARGHAILYAGKDEERIRARAPLEEALELDATLEEAVEALARIAVGMGDRTRAIALYSRGIETDRGYVPFWIGRGDAHQDLGERAQASGRDPRESFGAAEADFGRAIDLARGQARPLVRRGDVRLGWGIWTDHRGGDGEPLWLGAEADASAAIAIEATGPDAWRLRAAARAHLSRRLEESGKDGGERFEQSVADISRAIELAPADASYRLRRAQIRMNRGLDVSHRGGNPEPIWKESLADFAAALERDPNSEDAWRNRGSLRLNWGSWAGDRGADPEPFHAEAEQDLLHAADLAPRNAETWMALAGLCGNWALARARRGGDPAELYARADAHADRMLKANPALARGWLFRGSMRMNWGVRLHDFGRDPQETYARAEADLDRALELNPSDADAWSARASLYLNWGLDAGQRGGDAAERYRKGLADAEQAIARNPGASECWKDRAQLRSNLGILRAHRGEDPAEEYQAAVADYRKAAELNPKNPEVWGGLGDAQQNWGTQVESAGGDPTPLYTEAVDAYERALALNPGWGEGAWRRGVVRMNWGNYEMKAGREYAPRYEQAAADFALAAKINPRDADLWMSIGHLNFVWGLAEDTRGGRGDERYRSAEEAFAQAAVLNPGSADVRMRRGRMRVTWAEQREKRSEDPGDLRAQALADFDEALRLNPRHGESLAFRGLLHHHERRWTAAIPDLEAALPFHPPQAAYLRRLIAEAKAERAVEQASGEWRAALGAAEELLRAGDYAAARPEYERALERLRAAAESLDPPLRAVLDRASRASAVGALYNLACCHARAGDAGAAFERLDDAVRLGYADADHLAADEDLVPLHADPRWADLVAEVRGRGK